MEQSLQAAQDNLETALCLVALASESIVLPKSDRRVLLRVPINLIMRIRFVNILYTFCKIYIKLSQI